MRVDTANMLNITEANRRGVSKLASDAEHGETVVLLRNGKAVAAVVSVEKMQELELMDEREEDLRLLMLSLARVVVDDGGRVAFDDVLARFGLDRGDLVIPE